MPGALKRTYSMYRGQRPAGSRKRMKAKASTIRRIAKKAVWSTKETHMRTDYGDETSISSVAPVPSYYDSFSKLEQGDSYFARSGHKVKGVGIKIRSCFHNNHNGPMFLRFLVLVNKRGTADTDYTTGTSLFERDTGNLNFAAATGSLRMVSRINKEKYTVLRDRVLRFGGIDDQDRTKILTMWIPFRTLLQYDGSTATAPFLNQPIVLAFCGRGDTDETTGQNIEHTYSMDFYFKDM